MTHTLSAMRGTRREGLTERKSQARKNCNSLLLLLVEKGPKFGKEMERDVRHAGWLTLPWTSSSIVNKAFP